MKRKIRSTSIIREDTKSTNRPPISNSIRIKGIIILSLVLLVLVIINFSFLTASDSEEKIAETVIPNSNYDQWFADFRNVLSEFYIPSQWISGMNRIEKYISSDEELLTLRISFPREYAIHPSIFALIHIAEHNNLQLIESFERLSPCTMNLGLTGSNQKMIQIKFREDADLVWHSGQVAVVIDDFGYKMDETINDFLNIPFPITFAIIPGTDYAQQIAKKAHEAGYDILIHLPMEPLRSKVEQDGFTIMANMSERQVEQIVKKSMEVIPNAIGVNNHMGSKATANRMTMARLMRVLKKYNLLFLDSLTNRKSVAYQLANQTGVSALRMTTYLDNPNNSKTVSQKLEGVINNLDRAPNPIIIGHSRKETAQILTEEIPRWAYSGVSFVRLNQLLENL